MGKRKGVREDAFLFGRKRRIFYSIFRYGKFDEIYEGKFQLLRNGDLQYIE